jgi:FAD/FMN-containing dehydrogenase
MGSWNPADAPADFAITTQRFSGAIDVAPADLVVTAGAGIRWDQLRSQLAEHGVWVPSDPPGDGRSVGSVVATATTGPLMTGFGPLRNHLLGLTLVAGDGRIIRVGGRVAKNVAGFDLTKLATGSFGALGVITSVNFRLRAVPRADVTLVANNKRDTLLQATRDIIAEGVTPAALEMVSPKAGDQNDWTLAIREVGTDTAVEAARSTLLAVATPLSLRMLPPEDAARFWRLVRSRAVHAPTTIRCGTVPSGLDDALDALQHHLDKNCEDWITVNALAGMIRWSGSATADRIKLFRHVAAQREMPVTLERADWHVRSAVGHFGAYREGVGRLVSSLRRTFDPASVLVVPMSNDA